MDWFGIKRRKAERVKREKRAITAEAARRAKTQLERLERQRIRDDASARGENIRRLQEERRRKALEQEEADRQRRLNDSDMTTNMGVFTNEVVLDGGWQHNHQHSDPTPEPPSFTDDSSGSDYSSSDSSGSDAGGGGFDS